MFNLFKLADKQVEKEPANDVNQLDHAAVEQDVEQAKVHGQDGVCCGGCGGE